MFFLDGSFLAAPDAKISILDLGLLRGFAAFEYLRTYGKKPFYLEEHLRRFFYSLLCLGLEIPYSMNDLKKIVQELIQKENKDNIGVKILATGGQSPDQFLPLGKPSLILFTTSTPSFPPEYFSKGIATTTSLLQRTLPTAKTTSYLPAIVALQLAKGSQEVLFLNENQEFLEASTSNLFFIRKGALITSASDKILFGITREVVLELSKDLLKIQLENLPLAELDTLEEAFITATNKEIMPIASINGIPLKTSPGPYTQILMQRFKEFVDKGSWEELPITRHLLEDFSPL